MSTAYKSYKILCDDKDLSDKMTLSLRGEKNIDFAQESMDIAYKKISDELADELMINIMNQNPAFFERWLGCQK